MPQMNAKSKTIQDGYKIRNVRYEEIHNVPQDFFDTIVKGLSIKNGDNIGDLMSGYGAISREVLKYAEKNKKRIELWLLDNHLEQLDRSHEELAHWEHPSNLQQLKIHRIHSDARFSNVLKENSLDHAVMKMGLHEIPQCDQQGAVDNAYNWLKNGGTLMIWDRMARKKEDQELFSKIISEKDRLAGFDSFVKNRYFFRLDEGIEYMKKSGFKEVKVFKEIYLNFTSKVRLHTEFGGNENTLKSWNEFIRASVPEAMKKRLKYQDNGDDIKMVFAKAIICGKK